MAEKKSNASLYRELVEKLPEFLEGYLLNGLQAHSSLTRIAYARDIYAFFEFAVNFYPHFPGKNIKDITCDDLSMITAYNIDEYMTFLSDSKVKSKNGYSDKTKARKKASISTMYNYLINTERKLSYNPVDGAVKISISEKDYVNYLNLEEQQLLLDGIRLGTGLSPKALASHKKYVKRDLAIIFLFLDLGLRISELNGIDISDIDLDECSVIVSRKGNKYQKLYFSDESRELLVDYLEERKNSISPFVGQDPLFVTTKGERLAVRSIQQMVEKYMTAILPNKADIISPHKLRSSFAMTYYRQSGDILALQKQMGHKSITTTNIYAKATDAEMKNNRNWREDISTKKK